MLSLAEKYDLEASNSYNTKRDIFSQMSVDYARMKFGNYRLNAMEQKLLTASVREKYNHER